MPHLVGISNEVKGRQFPISQGETTIGRTPENNVAIESPTVSSRHAVITAADRVYTLQDLRSTNGTLINKNRIQQTRLRPNDIVQFGGIEFLFQAAPHEVEQDPAARLSGRIAVVEDNAPAATPTSFGSIAPFASPRKKKSHTWFIVLLSLGLMAIAVVILFFIKLLSTQ